MSAEREAVAPRPGNTLLVNWRRTNTSHGLTYSYPQGLISMPVGETKYGVLVSWRTRSSRAGKRYVHRYQPCTPSALAISLFRVARSGLSCLNSESSALFRTVVGSEGTPPGPGGHAPTAHYDT